MDAVQAYIQTKAQQPVSLDKLKILLANKHAQTVASYKAQENKNHLSIQPPDKTAGVASKKHIHIHCKAQLKDIQGLFMTP